MIVHFIGNPHREDHRREVHNSLPTVYCVPRPIDHDLMTLHLISPNWRGPVGVVDRYRRVRTVDPNTDAQSCHYEWIEVRP